MLPAASRERGWDFGWLGAGAVLPSCAAHSSLRKGACADHAGGSAAPGPSSIENETVQHWVCTIAPGTAGPFLERLLRSHLPALSLLEYPNKRAECMCCFTESGVSLGLFIYTLVLLLYPCFYCQMFKVFCSLRDICFHSCEMVLSRISYGLLVLCVTLEYAPLSGDSQILLLPGMCNGFSCLQQAKKWICLWLK